MAHERRINTWLVIGPFANHHASYDPRDLSLWAGELDKDFLAGESKARAALDASISGKSWMLMDDRLYCRNQDDYVDLSTFFMPRRPGAPAGGNTHVTAYAHVYVWSPIRQPAELWLGASGGLKSWMNGRLVATLPFQERQPIRDQKRFAVTLEAGWNRLLIKSVHSYRIWGFYAKLADAEGRPLNGLEYSADAPEGTLAITTTQWPKGFTGWPYLWLAVRGVKPFHSVPSASPLRLMAHGGRPPYRWSILEGNLPEGLTLDPEEGEILGVCGDRPATAEFALQVTDASGAKATALIKLTIADRPTRWYEDEKIGGLIHGSMVAEKAYQKPYGFPDQQAASMAREGYKYAAPTIGFIPDPTTWPGWYNPAYREVKSFIFNRHDEFMSAFRAKGIGFGSYLGLPDAKTYVYRDIAAGSSEKYEHWPRYLDGLHQYFEEWFAYARPVAIYLDGAGLAAPFSNVDVYDDRNEGYGFDALYSMGKTVSPATLIIANSCGNPGLDWRLGDCDVFSTEGMNDGNNPVWDRWPSGQSEHYPKAIPNASWRYPFKHPRWGDFITNYWDEWTRSVVSLIAEGYLVDLDHSVSEGREELHDQIGAWLEPRLVSLKGTRPGPILGAEWGYSVHKGDHVYLHVLSNKRGKTGMKLGQTQLIGRPVVPTVKGARLIPSGAALSFRQDRDELTINLSGASVDPVDTIIELLLAQPMTR